MSFIIPPLGCFCLEQLYLKQHETLDQSIIVFLYKIRQLDLTTRAPVCTCTPEDSVFNTIGKLSATKAHRVFIVDELFRPVRVVSLTDIILLILKGRATPQVRRQ